MTSLALERSASGSSSWSSREVRLGSFGGYKAGLSSSDDFGTKKIRQFRRKAIELTGYQILVNLRKDFAESFQTNPKAAQTVTVDASLNHPDLERAEKRLEFLAQLDLTESFEDLTPPSVDAFRDAGVLLRKFASVSRDCALPDLGMDSDGTIVLTYHPVRCGMVGSLSIFGDGTYSYCIEKEGFTVECGSTPISGPIAHDLHGFLVR
jgi:hypothetical protein